tara:strand:- start:331 stop:867 length:537 start_codon:yes stop_codon:yes gene_type:complete
MSETLIEKLDRIESELKKIQSIKPPKPIDYSKGISILEGINKDLSKRLLDITTNYDRLDKELTALKNKKPVVQVDYSHDVLALNKRVDKLIADNNKAIKQVDYSAQISKVDTKVNELSKLITSKVEVKHVDHSKELSLINSKIVAIKQSINKKQDIDIKSEIKKVVNIAYVTNLYRNK